METIIQKKPVWLKIIRWTARIIALLIIIIILLMLIGESIGSSSHKINLSGRDFLLLSLWGYNPDWIRDWFLERGTWWIDKSGFNIISHYNTFQ